MSASSLYDMICGHSRFLKLVLGPDSPVRTELLLLMRTLIATDPKGLCKPAQVSV